MSAGAREPLAREIAAFAAALTGEPATAYLVDKYERAHAALGLVPERGFDTTLVVLARRGRFAARLADAYAGLFARRSTLRRKLALAAALLEVTPPADAAFAPRTGSLALTAFRLAAAGAAELALALAAAPVLVPLQLASRLRRRR